MKRTLTSTTRLAVAIGLSLGVATPALAGFPKTPVKKCANNAVVAGTLCLDTYEASVWRVTDPSVVKKIQKGAVTLGDLSGSTQLGTASDDYSPCTDDGQNCTNDIYALSLPGVAAGRIHHLVPSPGSVCELRQTAADQRGVASGGERNAGPGTGQRNDGLQHGEQFRS